MDSLSKAKDGMQMQESGMIDSIEWMGVERSSHGSYEVDLSYQFQVDVEYWYKEWWSRREIERDGAESVIKKRDSKEIQIQSNGPEEVEIQNKWWW